MAVQSLGFNLTTWTSDTINLNRSCREAYCTVLYCTVRYLEFQCTLSLRDGGQVFCGTVPPRQPGWHARRRWILKFDFPFRTYPRIFRRPRRIWFLPDFWHCSTVFSSICIGSVVDERVDLSMGNDRIITLSIKPQNALNIKHYYQRQHDKRLKH